MANELRKQLVELIARVGFKQGEFTLASGKKSSYYIDLRNVSLHPRGLELISALVWSKLTPADFGGVGGPTMGADPLATALSIFAAQKGVELPAFIVRKEPKKYGTSKWIEGKENLISHRELLVVEDTITTGGSVVKAIEKLREEGFTVNKLVVVVDRQEGAAEALGKIGVEILALTTVGEIREIISR